MKVLAVSGYKPRELGIFNPEAEEIGYIKKTVKARISGFLEQGLEWVVVSGQPGVEQWAAEVVMELKQEGCSLRLAVLPPFLHQDSIWPDHAKERYQKIIAEADYSEAVSKKEYENPGQLRAKNDFIIMKTDALLVLYTEDQPGSPEYYLEAAGRRSSAGHYPVYRITPDDLQQTVEEEMLRMADDIE
ncbi:DUF1273 domain-containing protein [Salibacterium halotolerans]|uniref:Uncharacterized SPBc2 prophage-derived protein YoqJ n=1 Tax=Salibacterium halotolerans TaxID=1884432 RepID=A0A1I5UTJ4_9BACI|nr:DUF1273 domain-containing protein [Salibacterium halotolerans]SFP98046.1 Uncharacterized SPBc2 prophage-derived protein YoqJ [Salibacterium halotolerans]